ncbi:MAG: aspartyl/glutamyl-tRNA(Asn/Gln) amidotransferase subunit B [Candidatus Parcubacteria bacterium]|nr:MAG: aspartyl/glutamyl-tRNA(Asn/Gln) amidotransferase subunit B [Candidatus Parcubacteria bacterium]
MEFEPTIGLEIHAELATYSKMFCSCPNQPDDLPPNTAVCPVCLAHPGTLPVPNKEAIRHILRIGIALGGELAFAFSEFDRKNYFYADIPKGFQLSQYAYPFVRGGALRGIAITRVHLEEDTARSYHEKDGTTLIDFNRAGVPLMELVTEPVIRSGEDAAAFARELQILLRTLGASRANMEKGEMRVEANVSVAPKGAGLGTKVEVKNLNSFRAVEKAIAYEIQRQISLLREGREIRQETRGWDEVKEQTFPQRRKETAHDYRYFPEPDIPKLRLERLAEEHPEWRLEEIRRSLPELPWKRRERYGGLGIPPEQCEMLVANLELADFFDAVVTAVKGEAETARLAANYLLTDIVGAGGIGSLKPEGLAEAVRLYQESALSSRGVKEVLQLLRAGEGEGKAARTIAEQHNLLQVSDEGALDAVVREVLEREEKAVAEYCAGKEAALQYLVGQGMRESKGSANPQKLKDLFKQKIQCP